MPPVKAQDLDLNLLLALEALLSETSVTKAAERVGLTQSAMSHKLRRLRELFDDPLLVNARGGMMPTPRADALRGPLRHHLGELSKMLERRREFDPAIARRTFTVITTDYAEFRILPMVLEHISHSAPNIDLRVLEPSTQTPTTLEDGSADLAVGVAIEPRAGLVQSKVAEDHMVGLARTNHPVVESSIDLETYAALPHAVMSDGRSDTSAVDEALAMAGKARRIAIRLPHFLGLPFVVARSDLIATISRTLAIESCGLLPLRVFDVPLKLPPIRVFMTWHERFGNDPGHRWLREITRRFTLACVEPGAATPPSPPHGAPASHVDRSS